MTCRALHVYFEKGVTLRLKFFTLFHCQELCKLIGFKQMTLMFEESQQMKALMFADAVFTAYGKPHSLPF